jgi:hypothetical protein
LSRYKQNCTTEYIANYEKYGKEKLELLKMTKHGETGVLFSRPMSLEERKNWEEMKWLIF